MSDVINILPKETAFQITVIGVDEYVNRMQKLFKGKNFIRDLNQCLLMEKIVPCLSAQIREDLARVSSGSSSSHYIPENMLKDLRSEQKQIGELNYYGAVAHIFQRLQEHDAAYAMCKMALIADRIARSYSYYVGTLEDAYRQQEDDLYIKTMLRDATHSANHQIAKACVVVRKKMTQPTLILNK